MAEPLLEVTNIETRYGLSQVLFGISLAIAPGEMVTLMGRNGMGKTTTVRSVMGLTPAMAGSIRFDGRRLRACRRSAWRSSASAWCLRAGRYFPISPRARIWSRLPRTAWAPPTHGRWTRSASCFRGSASALSSMGNLLSGGEQQMLAVGRALMTNPRLLILDEATEGLAPLIRAEIWQCLTRLKAAGQSILVIDKNVAGADPHRRPALSDRAGQGGVVRHLGGARGGAASAAPVSGHLAHQAVGLGHSVSGRLVLSRRRLYRRAMATLSDQGFLEFGDLRLEYRMAGPRPHRGADADPAARGSGLRRHVGRFPRKAVGCDRLRRVRLVARRLRPVESRRNCRASSISCTSRREQILPRLLDAIGFRQGLLVGHSDGASIAAIYGGSVQDHRVRGLVLMAPHFIVEDVTINSIREIRQAFDTTDVRQRFQRWHADADATVRGWTDVWMKNDFNTWDISEELAYIRVPILIIQGEHDHYGTARQIEIAREECYCPVDVLLIPGIQHIPHREAPEVTLKAIAEFVASPVARARQPRRDAPLPPKPPNPLKHPAMRLEGRATVHHERRPCTALSYMNYNAVVMAKTIDTREISDVAGRADAAFAGEVGRMVRLGRAKRGMSRRQLAQESGTSERYLAQIESGAGNPSILVMRAIADALEIPLFEMLPQTGGLSAPYARIIDLLGVHRRAICRRLPKRSSGGSRAPPRPTAAGGSRSSVCAAPANPRSARCWRKSSACRSSSSTAWSSRNTAPACRC